MADDDIITTKDAVKALIHECGGYKRVAKEFDVSLARLYTFTDPAFLDHNMTYKRVAQLTERHQATAAARDLAQRAGGVFLPLARRTVDSAMTLVGQSALSNGEALSATVQSLADGKVNAAEKRATVKEIDEAIRDLASLRSALVAMADDQ
jgi:hypothetical protein